MNNSDFWTELKYILFSFEGRIDRSWFWYYILLTRPLYVFPFVILFGIFNPTMSNETPNIAEVIRFILSMIFIFGMFAYLLTFYTDIAVSVKRLHDTNRSGVHLLSILAPCFGALYILIVCGFLKGTEGENRYGMPSNGSFSSEQNEK